MNPKRKTGTLPTAVHSRREGFVGQHLVVVPEPVRRLAAEHPLLKGLMVTDAGYFPSAAGHRVERPQGASTHLLILCLQGKGWARSDGRSVQVAQGDVLWLRANTPHSYGADPEEPWTIVWVHFRGEEVSGWQRELGWAERPPPCVASMGADRLASLGLDKVYARLRVGYAVPDLLGAAALLRSVFCGMLDLAKDAGAEKTAAERTAAVREAIIKDPARPYRLGELATGAGLSVAHFCVLFRRQSGYAPIDFLIRQRIRAACRLLDRTQASIAAISQEAGFEDPYYFSRCFRRVMGCSPRSYRGIVKG